MHYLINCENIYNINVYNTTFNVFIDFKHDNQL